METLNDVVTILSTGHIGLTLGRYLVNALLGAVGAFVAAVAASEEDRIILPSYANGQINLGILGPLVVGAGAALVVGYSGWVPLVSGMVAEIVVPEVLRMIGERVRKWKQHS